MNTIKEIFDLANTMTGTELPKTTVERFTWEDGEESLVVFHSPHAFRVTKRPGEEVLKRTGWEYVEGTVYSFSDFSVVYDGGYKSIDKRKALKLLESVASETKPVTK